MPRRLSQDELKSYSLERSVASAALGLRRSKPPPSMARTTRRDSMRGYWSPFYAFCTGSEFWPRISVSRSKFPELFRLSSVPRSITWGEVRRVLEAVDRRTVRGRRDYAILLMLVTYGLRACEVARLTLDDIDRKHERLQIPDRKAGNSSCLSARGVVAEALIDYLKKRAARNCRKNGSFSESSPPRALSGPGASAHL